MGLVADLTRRNEVLEARVAHLEAAFDGIVTLLQSAYERLDRIQSGAPIPLGDGRFFDPQAPKRLEG